MPPGRIPLMQVPAVIGGVMTVKCECGWEACFIQPEEHIWMMTIVFQHLQEKHEVVIPTICCYWH